MNAIFFLTIFTLVLFSSKLVRSQNKQGDEQDGNRAISTTRTTTTTTKKPPILTTRTTLTTTKKPSISTTRTTTTITKKPPISTTRATTTTTKKPPISTMRTTTTTTKKPPISTTRTTNTTTKKPSISTTRTTNTTTKKPSILTTRTTSTTTRKPSISTTRATTTTTKKPPPIGHECGVPAITPIPSNIKIVGGIPAKPHSWPWQISIRKNPSADHICGGSILNETIIVTAAHCFESNNASKKDFFIIAGDHDQTTSTDGPTQMRQISWFRVHKAYNSSLEPPPNDIAIIVLSSPLQFNDNISAICLPNTNIISAKDCYSTGWGNTQNTGKRTTLNQARLPIINLATCQALSNYSLVLSSMICAGYLDGKVDTCDGDSGGPFVCKNANGRWYLDGIVSWGISCAQANHPGIYTRTFSFLNWIREITGFTG